MMAVNKIFRGYGHRFAYDAETMEGPHVQVGFNHITRFEFRRGRYAPLLIDSELRAPQSFSMEVCI
jgi:hypothetical protein